MALRLNTKSLLGNALEELLLERPLELITVNDITRHCGASRTTFYRHFKDKYDLMNWIYKDSVDKILAEYPDIHTWRQWLVQVLYFISGKSNYFHRILDYRDQNSFTEFLFGYSFEYCYGKIQEMEGPNSVPKETEYAVRIYCAGCSYTVQMWIRGGCVETCEELATLLCQSIPDPMKVYFG